MSAEIKYLNDTNLNDLAQDVNKHLWDGWQVFAPLVVDPPAPGETALYIQPIHRYPVTPETKST